MFLGYIIFPTTGEEDGADNLIGLFSLIILFVNKLHVN